MNKTQLICKVQERTSLTRTEAETAVIAVLDCLFEALERGETVVTKGFGTFRIVKKSARTGRNPQTGEILDIPERTTVKFTPSKQLKERLNQTR